MRMHLVPLLAAGALAATVVVRAAEPSRLAPIPVAEAKSTHGPFQSGNCETCHERHDAVDPGRAVKVSNDLCFDCHDEFKKQVRGHPATAKSGCVACHSPHNSRKKKLLL